MVILFDLVRGDQEKIPGTYGGGGWVVQLPILGFFSDLFWGFVPQLFAQFLLFFSIFAPKYASSNKKGSISYVKTMFRSDILRTER